MANKKPTPKTQREISNNQVKPYVNPETGTSLGNPNNPKDFRQFSPISQKGVDFNRSEETSLKDNTSKPFVINIQDIDEAIFYYFNNIIKPFVYQNGERIQIPLMYGSPERFKTLQKDGIFRDKKGKIMNPIIAFKRDNIEKIRSISNKLDANTPHLYTSWQKAYDSKNIYSNFEVLNNRTPSQQFMVNIIPDYVQVTYSFIIQTYYIEQLNKVIEAINYASDSYWGDPERFKFRARIDSFPTTTEISKGRNRVVRSNFTLNLFGHLIPDVLQKDLTSIKTYYNRSKLTFTSESTGSVAF